MLLIVSIGDMVTPNDAISAAIAATSSHEPDGSRKERPLSAVAPSTHKKTISGSLTSSFAFLRSNSSPEHGFTADSTSPVAEQPSSPRSRAMAAVIQQRKTRSRKDSLRKSALLGTSKLRMDGRDRHASSGLEEFASSERRQGDGPESGSAVAPCSPSSSHDLPTPRPGLVPPPVPMVTHPVHGDPSKILEVTDAMDPFPDIKRPFVTKSSTASTTDDDESLTSPSDFVPTSIRKIQPLDSYFPPQPLRAARTQPTVPKSHSPLATVPASKSSTPPSEWDYSETRWWGWIILCVTWVVFVVGMGSCFGVWSWAWDVGETPYAPPELEDDPTLPIVGYYPALLVLTCVMAWVWVTVAWVGMKYFKHANISGDEE